MTDTEAVELAEQIAGLARAGLDTAQAQADRDAAIAARDLAEGDLAEALIDRDEARTERDALVTQLGDTTAALTTARTERDAAIQTGQAAVITANQATADKLAAQQQVSTLSQQLIGLQAQLDQANAAAAAYASTHPFAIGDVYDQV